jgi:hypothetical protein
VSIGWCAAHADLGLEGWYHIRTPLKQEWDLESRPGSLGLTGGPYPIRTDECTTMLLQKQTAFQGEWRVVIDYEPEENMHQAGVAIWWSRWAMASVAARVAENGREIVFTAPVEGSDDFTVGCDLNRLRAE